MEVPREHAAGAECHFGEAEARGARHRRCRVKIALLQLNARLGDPEGNGRRLEAAYAEAVRSGAELALAPELAIPGYLLEDRLWEPGLRRRIEAESLRLAALSGPVPLVFGTATAAPSGRLWNELWWCEGRELRHCARKRVLPSYDVFDEHRYFEPDASPQPLVAFRDHRIGLSICEDLWADPQLGNVPVGYGLDPIADLAAAGATLILNASASPSALGSWLPAGRSAPWAIPSKEAQRRRLLPGLSQKHGLPIAYASRVGAESWLLFDGGSGLALPDGRWQGGEAFEEGTLMVDPAAPGRPWRAVEEGPWLRHALVTGIRDNLAKQGLGAVVWAFPAASTAPWQRLWRWRPWVQSGTGRGHAHAGTAAPTVGTSPSSRPGTWAWAS